MCDSPITFPTTLSHKLSDLVSLTDLSSLPENGAVFAHVGTGGGKSYFCMNTLYDFSASNKGRILYIINRKNAYLQFRHLLESNHHDDRITILTYQAIEQMYLGGGVVDFSQYEYVVYDEYHRFFTDSLVDKYSDIVLSHMFDSSCKRFFLSATPFSVDRHLQSLLDERHLSYKEYSLPCSYSMASLHTFKRTADIHHILKDIEASGQKTAVCFSSAKMAYQYHKDFPDSLFVCSDSNTSYSKYVDVKSRQNMIVNEKFSEKYLFCTTCLDAGFNIRDDDLAYTISDLDDPDQLVQWIGRKRFNTSHDEYHIYIKDVSFQEMEASIQRWEQKILKATFLKEEGQESYAIHFGTHRDFNTSEDLIYVDVDESGALCLKVMEMQYQYYKHRIWRYRDIIDSGLSYRAYMQRLLNCHDIVSPILTSKRAYRIKFLESQVGRDIFVKDRKDFYDALGYVDSNKHRVKSLEEINKCLWRDKIPYRLEYHYGNYPSRKRKITWWTVVKIVMEF